MLMMAVVLYEDFGIRYNPNRITTGLPNPETDRFFADSRSSFSSACWETVEPHLQFDAGALPGDWPSPGLSAETGDHQGAFVPAVGRCRERFNLEATGKGMNRYDDENFRQWPFPVTEQRYALRVFEVVECGGRIGGVSVLARNCLKEAGRLTKPPVVTLRRVVCPGLEIVSGALRSRARGARWSNADASAVRSFNRMLRTSRILCTKCSKNLGPQF